VSRRTKALLLAGGLGTRLRPLTDRLPKCLVPIAGKALLDYWLESIERAGIEDVLINTHHLRPQVWEHCAERMRTRPRLRIHETYEPALLGSAGTLHANAGWMDDADDCVIIYADNLSNVALTDLLTAHRAHGAPLTMMLFRHPFPEQAGIVELDADGRVVSFVEKPSQPASDLANAGLYALDALTYREIAAQDAFDIGFDVLPRYVGRMRGWLFEGYHRDIGTLEALEQARAAAPRVFRTG
jgi:mannose-1-phosphate guanylyltransferase